MAGGAAVVLALADIAVPPPPDPGGADTHNLRAHAMAVLVAREFTRLVTDRRMLRAWLDRAAKPMPPAATEVLAAVEAAIAASVYGGERR